MKYLLLIPCFLALGTAVLYWQVFQPIREHSRLSMMAYEGELVNPDELREVAHRSLRWSTVHDAFLSLVDVGDQTSIPVLIRSLGRVEKPNQDGTVVCTSAHCLQALRTVTGEDFGYDVPAWKRWYETGIETFRAGNSRSGGAKP